MNHIILVSIYYKSVDFRGCTFSQFTNFEHIGMFLYSRFYTCSINAYVYKFVFIFAPHNFSAKTCQNECNTNISTFTIVITPAGVLSNFSSIMILLFGISRYFSGRTKICVIYDLPMETLQIIHFPFLISTIRNRLPDTIECIWFGDRSWRMQNVLCSM